MKERDERAAKLKAEHEAVTAKMEALAKLGQDIDAQMAEAGPQYNAAVEELKELSSNDLTRLVQLESPEKDIEKVMDSVMVLLGESTGWEAAQKAIVSKDFMYNVGNYDYEKVSASALEQIQAWKGDFDPETLGAKTKAARAFALWVLAVQRLCVVHQQCLPAVKAT